MMVTRGIDKRFLFAMRKKLEHGRRRGYVGWDQRWQNCLFPTDPEGSHGFMATRLLQEVCELIASLDSGDKERIKEEAADVANIAMMIADIHDALGN